MNAIYEYILGGLILLVMLVAAQTNVYNMVTGRLALIEQEGYSAAGSILDMILLAPGDPPNWGDLPSAPVLFGLASEAEIETYALDAKKVARLSENSSLYISPGTLKALLGLNSECNLIIRVTPIFIIDINSEVNGNYSITVTSYKGPPVANVNVTGYYVHKSLGIAAEYACASRISGLDGKCTLSFTPKTDYVLVVCADLLGVRAMQTCPADMNFIVEGNQVIISDAPLIHLVNCTSSSFYGLNTDRAARFVNIEGFTYYFELEVWR